MRRIANRVRLGVERLFERRRRRKVGESIAEAYRRAPQTEPEVGWDDDATMRMIAAETLGQAEARPARGELRSR